jgi:hypothetical protein
LILLSLFDRSARLEFHEATRLRPTRLSNINTAFRRSREVRTGRGPQTLEALLD